MTKEEFYNECANILQVEHNYLEFKPRIKVDRSTGEIIHTSTVYGRWGPRKPGNGRFPGFGLVRVFSPSNILVSLHHPKLVSRTFSTYDEVLSFLKKLVDVD